MTKKMMWSIGIVIVVMVVAFVFMKTNTFGWFGAQNQSPVQVALQECGQIKDQLDRLVRQNIDETSLHSVVCLLGVELQIVDKLLNCESGAAYDKLLAKRKKLLECATKTTFHTYKMVMKLATNEVVPVRKNGKSRSDKVLCDSGKRGYLMRMKNRLVEYREKFLNRLDVAFRRTVCP